MKKGDKLLDWVNFLNDTRKFALQYMDCSLKVPLVLHLAKGLEEYVIDWGAKDEE